MVRRRVLNLLACGAEEAAKCRRTAAGEVGRGAVFAPLCSLQSAS